MSHCSEPAVVLPFTLVCLNVITSTVKQSFMLHRGFSDVSKSSAESPGHFQIIGCYFVAADCGSSCIKSSKRNF